MTDLADSVRLENLGLIFFVPVYIFSTGTLNILMHLRGSLF